MTDTALPIGVIGSHEPDYPRHLVLEAALRHAGRTLHIRNSRIAFPWRHLSIASHFWSLPKEVRVVYVTEGAHRLVPMMRLWAKATNRKLLFDPFLSRYNTRVEDRRLYEPGSLQARIAHWQDWSSCKSSDYLIFDTDEHRDYFFTRYGLRVPSAIVPVGVPEEIFQYPSSLRKEKSDTFEVLFYGTFIPLQGIETIVNAAALLPNDVRITIIGKGQTWDAVMSAVPASVVADGRLRFEDPVPFETIPNRLTRADIALGIFGSTDKATRVVPNKVVQAAAMGRPMITADTPAIRRYFTPDENIMLVPANDAASLAKAVLTLKDNLAMCARLGKGARRVFEAEFSLEAISRKLIMAVEHLESDKGTD